MVLAVVGILAETYIPDPAQQVAPEDFPPPHGSYVPAAITTSCEIA